MENGILGDNSYIFVLLWSFSGTLIDRQTDQLITQIPTVARTVLAWHRAEKAGYKYEQSNCQSRLLFDSQLKEVDFCKTRHVFEWRMFFCYWWRGRCGTSQLTDGWTYDNAAAVFWIISCCCCCVSCAVCTGFLTFQRTFYQRYVRHLRSMAAWLPQCLLVYQSVVWV